MGDHRHSNFVLTALCFCPLCPQPSVRQIRLHSMPGCRSPAHNPQGRICCASIPNEYFLYGVLIHIGEVIRRIQKGFSLGRSRAVLNLRYFFMYYVLTDYPFGRFSSFRIFRKNKILFEGNFVRITDRDYIPSDRLLSSRTTSSKSAPALPRVAILLPYSAKTKPSVNILLELSPLV